MTTPTLITDANGVTRRLGCPTLEVPRRDPLTVAYIAIGAARAIDEVRLAEGFSNLDMGELEFISDCITEADELDALGYANADALSSVVWSYEVAEEYGARIAALVIKGEPIDRAALRAAVIADAIKGGR
jgi:hypothetical protein